MTREEAIKIVQSATVWTDEERDALAMLIPELAESEDERIRKAIIKSIEEDSSVYEQEVSKEQMITWLEKQKEHHLELKAGKWYICHRAFCARADHLTVKEGERFQCEKDGIVKGFVIKEPEKYFKECSTTEPMEKEQKPVKGISQQTVQGKGVYKICPRCKERMVRDDSMVYTSMPPQYRYECPKCGESECDTVMYDNPEMEEQKPVVTHGETYHVDTLGTQQVIAGKMPQKPEWSEEDKGLLLSTKCIIDEVWHSDNIFGYSKEELEEIWNWLNVAWNRLEYPKEKDEWSEDYRKEDIQTRFAFYTYKDDPSTLYLSNVFVEESSRNKGFGTKILAAAEKVAETLGIISIRLKVKRDSPANVWYRKHGYGIIGCEGDYDWLEKDVEYLKPIHWKPSKEQISALNYFIKLWSNSDDRLEYPQIFNTVKSLRDDLEELM